MEIQKIDEQLRSLRRQMRVLENKRKKAIKREHARIERDIHKVLQNMIQDPTPAFTHACVKQTHHLLKQMASLRKRARSNLPFSEKTGAQLKRFQKILKSEASGKTSQTIPATTRYAHPVIVKTLSKPRAKPQRVPNLFSDAIGHLGRA